MASSTPPSHSHQSTSDDGKSSLFNLNLNFLKFRTEKKTQGTIMMLQIIHDVNYNNITTSRWPASETTGTKAR